MSNHSNKPKTFGDRFKEEGITGILKGKKKPHQCEAFGKTWLTNWMITWRLQINVHRFEANQASEIHCFFDFLLYY